jgi:signal transduction histidine kinase
MAIAGGHGAARMTGSDVATRPTGSVLRRVLTAPFSRRSWAELGYLLISVPLAVAGFAFTVATAVPPVLASVSAPGVRKFGDASRGLARGLLGEGVPAARDRTAWRARGYLLLKLPLTVAGSVVAAGCWLGGLFFLTIPVLFVLLTPPVLTDHRSLCRSGGRCIPIPSGSGSSAHTIHQVSISVGGLGTLDLSNPLVLLPFGAALLLAAPWLTNAITQADRSLIRGLLGPASRDERVVALEETRARAVDHSAARLRGIERDLHDGTQAQLVALAMKLGLAKEKLGTAGPQDMARATQLVDDAHRGVIEAIADLRVLARGIHPPVLDNGLADALTTLATRSTLPVELVTDIPERPSPAIETIAYFSAAELLTNAAKHSGARHVTLEAVHVCGLLRIRVRDDGNGGACPVPDGGLHGLADRVRTVDGRLDISSPAGGPTVVTVELPSHA